MPPFHFKRSWLPVLCLAAASLSCKQQPAPDRGGRGERPAVFSEPAPLDRAANDVGRFLAGLPGAPGSSFADLEKDQAWIAHSRELNEDWTRIETSVLPAMSRFRTEWLSAPPVGRSAVFYPFSGPDALMINVFFPQCPAYLMVGLEPPGTLPSLRQLSRKDLPVYLRAVRQTIHSELHRSFFITREMDREFRGQVNDGLLPTILQLLVRSRHTIAGYRRVSLTESGAIVDRASGETLPHGVQVDFQSGSEPLQRLYYFSVNLDDSHLAKNQAFLHLLGRLAGMTTYMKATSYMPHQPGFSIIRREILSHSAAVLQDDSGIPYRFFGSQWRVQLFGAYDRPYGSFKWLAQADLKRAYETQNPAPLGFRIGYGYSKAPSNLMLAVRK